MAHSNAISLNALSNWECLWYSIREVLSDNPRPSLRLGWWGGSAEMVEQNTPQFTGWGPSYMVAMTDTGNSAEALVP